MSCTLYQRQEHAAITILERKVSCVLYVLFPRRFDPKFSAYFRVLSPSRSSADPFRFLQPPSRFRVCGLALGYCRKQYRDPVRLKLTRRCVLVHFSCAFAFRKSSVRCDSWRSPFVAQNESASHVADAFFQNIFLHAIVTHSRSNTRIRIRRRNSFFSETFYDRTKMFVFSCN